MKKLFFLAFLALGTLTAQAQSETAAKKSCSASAAKKCAKTCTAKKSATQTTINEAPEYNVVMAAATAAAESDETIEKRVCAKSGAVSFTKKHTCPASGKVSYTDVEYCAKSQKFVNVSPKDAEATKVNMQEGEAAPKKACSASAAKKCSKPCSAKKTATTQVAPVSEEMPKATKVNLEDE